MANRSLYQISTELETLNDSLVDSGGELTEETQIALAILETDLKVKGANYGLVILMNTADIAAVDCEIERLTKKKKALANTNDRLKFVVQTAMEHFGIEKIETPLVKLSFRPSESVNITDEKSLPAEYVVTEPVVTKPNKAKIKEAIKEGTAVAGAELVTKRNLQIK